MKLQRAPRRRTHEQQVASGLAGVGRRPHPAVSQKPLTERQVEFSQAMAAFQADQRSLFPSWSDVLSVVDGLGYVKRA